jgi:hypothetical protein
MPSVLLDDLQELKCDWPGCGQHFFGRVYHFEGKKFCSFRCMEEVARQEISRTLFQAPKRYVIDGKMLM